ncbi:MAG: hypothetical protein IKK21_07985 [Clostridia bacterium]|nr:hypothetical protein [Clostridia bacterium]
MGSFANSAFSIILGWIRSAVSGLWQMVFATGDNDFVRWIGDNWLALVIALCAVCTLVDVIVHLIRWRPMQVWASFFRRLRSRDEEEEEEEARPTAAVRREWYYPDGTARTEEVLMPEEEAYAQQPEWAQPPAMRAGSTPLSDRYVRSFARPQVHPAVAEKPIEYEDYPVAPLPGEELPQFEPLPVEVEEIPPEPVRTPEHFSRSKRVLQRVAKLPRTFGMTEDDDELQLRFQPAPPAVNKEAAYHAPVYPPSWKPPEQGVHQEEQH